MSLIRYQDPELAAWTPFDRLSSLREEMNRLLDGSLAAFGTFGTRGARDFGLFSGWTPPVDVSQDKEHVYIKAELPGLKREDIDISLQNGMLTISGERKEESEVREGETFRSERVFGRFHRTVSLPTQVDADRVSAAYKDGILTVTLPKAEEAKAKQIQVNVA